VRDIDFFEISKAPQQQGLKIRARPCMNFDLSRWPEFDRTQLGNLALVPFSSYPELDGYTRADVHEGLQGQGGLFLAADMARALQLQPGMHVLDLACGNGATAVFLARHYGVRVSAVDERLSPNLTERAAKHGVSDRVIAVQTDARQLPFDEGSFDAVFCMNAYFYFGTDDRYLPYLLRFVADEGRICIGGPCYRDELFEGAPEEFLLEFPDCLAVHSPDWWRNHFLKTRMVDVLDSSLHPRGHDFWEDRVRFLAETQTVAAMEPWKQQMLHAILRMLNRDVDHFVSHFTLSARMRKRDHVFGL
jgi:SAM-dependent methyltransferase